MRCSFPSACALGLALASLAPLGLVPSLCAQTPKPAEAADALKAVKVGVNVIPNVVQFETTRFDVHAGGPVELTLKNGCIMPHNLVILEPGAEAAVTAGVNAMGLEGMEKHFVPAVPGIVAATKLLPPGGKEVLEFKAPEKPGDYPYVCTFPGHWFTMRGVMRVRAAGKKLEAPVRQGDKTVQVEDALKTSGMSHMPMGTLEKPFVMRSFVGDPGLDPAVFAHHGTGRTAIKYDPKTRQDITRKEKDPVTGAEKEVPVLIPSLRGIAGAIAVNHGPELSYVWDSTECRLMYAWRGGFLDMNTYWGKEPGSGRPKIYIPLIVGNLVYRTSGPAPTAAANDPAPVFLGYKMEGGAPVFRYRLGERVLREQVVPKGKDGFEVRVSAETPAGAPVNWSVPAADAGFVKTRSEGGAVVVSIQDRPEKPLPANADYFKAELGQP